MSPETTRSPTVTTATRSVTEPDDPTSRVTPATTKDTPTSETTRSTHETTKQPGSAQPTNEHDENSSDSKSDKLKGETFTGKATYFYQMGAAGACGNKNPDSALICALAPELYANGANCGRKLEIIRTGSTKKVIVEVADLCPGGCDEKGSVDLSEAAFLVLGTKDEGTIAYDFVNAAEEEYLLKKIDAVGQGNVRSTAWQPLNGRRSMYWGGALTKAGALVPTSFPQFMTTAWPNVLPRIDELGVFDQLDANGQEQGGGPNHCLVNEYLPGQGIMPHTDGPAYSPVVATLSLGSHAILKFTPRPPQDDSGTTGMPDSAEDSFTVFLPTRSLVVLSSTVYSNYLHSIDPVKVDTMSDLIACINWEDWWQFAAGGLWSELEQAKTGTVVESLTGQDVQEVGSSKPPNNRRFDTKKELVEEVVARRRMVENAKLLDSKSAEKTDRSRL
ncbi:hypothetical protein OIV83_003778 [Microbotryomycetes sp. JL201]|nr:hypothetical protein OIV83_003778 [Microbotryomycetes sp. JL201]